MKNLFHFLVLAALLCSAQFASAEMINFENAGEFGGDNGALTVDYLKQYGVSFTAMAGMTESDAKEASLYFEATGTDGSDAYVNGLVDRSSNDRMDSSVAGDLGNYFIKAGTGNMSYSKSEYFKLNIDYIDPTTAASGELWDIDGPEQYQVTAMDANGNALATVTSPIGGLDAEPWAFSFDVGDAGVQIASLELEFIGEGTLRGFAFDNFNATGANPDVVTTHAAPVPMALPLGLVGLMGVAHRRRRLRTSDRESNT